MEAEVWGDIAPEMKAFMESLSFPGIKYMPCKGVFTGSFPPRKIGAAPPSDVASSPFIVVAHMKAKAGNVEGLLKWYADADKAVEDVETGMLMNILVAHEDDPLKFTVVEVYENDAAFLAHMGNPAVGAAMAPEVMGAVIDGAVEAEVWGDIAPETKALMESLSFPGIKYMPCKGGFTGSFSPRTLPK